LASEVGEGLIYMLANNLIAKLKAFVSKCLLNGKLMGASFKDKTREIISARSNMIVVEGTNRMM